MSKLKIIAMLWSAIYDLKMVIQGTSRKSMDEIEVELDKIEYHCRKYVDIDDVEEME